MDKMYLTKSYKERIEIIGLLIDNGYGVTAGTLRDLYTENDFYDYPCIKYSERDDIFMVRKVISGDRYTSRSEFLNYFKIEQKFYLKPLKFI